MKIYVKIISCSKATYWYAKLFNEKPWYRNRVFVIDAETGQLEGQRGFFDLADCRRCDEYGKPIPAARRDAKSPVGYLTT